MKTPAILLGFMSTGMTAAGAALEAWGMATLFFCMLVMLMAGEVVDAIKGR